MRDDGFTRLVTANDEKVARDLLENDPGLARRLREVAMAEPHALSGRYHRNVRVGTLLVRFPAPVDRLDFRLLRESDVLRAVRPVLGGRASRLVYERDDWSVHMFVEGRLLCEAVPPHQPVPRSVLAQMADLFGDLSTVEWRDLPLYVDWPDGDCVAFGWRLAKYVTLLNRPEFQRLGIPEQPLAGVRWTKLCRRPFQILHNDLHRENVIVLPDGRVVVLDWELALVGDPLCDLATHLYYMRYRSDDRDTMMGLWLDRMPGPATRGWEVDLEVYFAFNHLRSTFIDLYRAIRTVAKGALSPDAEYDLIVDVTGVVNRASHLWHGDPHLSADRVADVVHHVAGKWRRHARTRPR